MTKNERLASLVSTHLSGENCLGTTSLITQFYRTPGSAGYHAATNLVRRKLEASGFDDIAIETYPIDGETKVMGSQMPMAWEPYAGSVGIVSPTQHHLVDFESAPTCLAVWSQSTGRGGETAEVVDVGDGASDEDWNRDLAGKVAFIRHSGRRALWKYAAARALAEGARGVLTDYLLYPMLPYRTREALPDAVQFLRLPNSLGQHDAWGFSLSHRAGQKLSELLRLGPVSVHAHVDCRTFKGHGQTVIAEIPGRELPEETVLLVAHTTGTKPGGNCASGDALMVEVARVLKRLIDGGELERPRRSIRFLAVAEGPGSETYIEARRNELDNIKAAVCLGSVGNDQALLKSTLMYSRHPDSSPSFVNDYFEVLMDRVPKDARWIGRDVRETSSVVFTSEPYTPWSDNNRFASFGIPSPLILSSPSIHFHTQFLTAETMDPKVFERAGVVAASGIYEIADAGCDEAVLMARDVMSNAVRRLQQVASGALRGDGRTAGRSLTEDSAGRVDYALRQINYLRERDIKAIQSTLTLVDDRSRDAAARELNGLIERLDREAERTGEWVRQRGSALC
jgi:hypothetical protein